MKADMWGSAKGSLAAVLLLTGACGGDSGQPAPTEPPAVVAPGVKSVGVEGGAVVLSNGASLTIPPEALDTRVEVTLSVAETEPPADLKPASRLYEFGPVGTVFAQPVTVSLPLTGDLDNPTLYWSKADGSGYEAVGGVVVEGRLVAQVLEFTPVARAQRAGKQGMQQQNGPPSGFVGQGSGKRTVKGGSATTWLSEARPLQNVQDSFTGKPVSALVLGADGKFTEYPGNGSANGFSIANVPEGTYYLKNGTTYYVTSESVVDLGRARLGRSDTVKPTAFTRLSFTVDNLRPWQLGDHLEFFSTNSDSWFFYLESSASNRPAEGATALAGMRISSDTHPLIDGAKGDRAILAQLSRGASSTGVPYTAMSRYVEFPSFTQVDGGTQALTGTLKEVSTDNTVAFDWKQSQYRRYSTSSVPSIDSVSSVLIVQGHPDSNSHGMYSSTADFLHLETTGDADIQTGDMTYGVPLSGRWGQSVLSSADTLTRFQLPNTARGVRTAATTLTIDTLEAARANPVSARLSPVRNPTLNGADFFRPAVVVEPHPELKWEAPELGTPRLYQVQVRRLYVDSANATRLAIVGSIYTSGLSVRVPSDLLVPGHSYVLYIFATANETSTPTRPLRNSLPSATASVVSNVIEVKAAP